MKMIFYHPIELDDGVSLQSGSVIRPKMMINGFKKIGYEVFYIAGSINKRKKIIEQLISSNKIYDYDFMYIESANIPMALSNSGHRPIQPLADLENIKKIKKCGLKVGLFYRDIFWRLDGYERRVGLLKSIILKTFFTFEFRRFSKIIDIFFLPTYEFADKFPIKLGDDSIYPLYPASKQIQSPFKKRVNKVRVLYTGNISIDYYDISNLIEATLHCSKEVFLTINTSKESYENYIEYYYNKFPILKKTENIRFVNIDYDKNLILARENDIGICRFNQSDLTSIAMPIKTFDYIGMGLPVIADKNTPYGDFIEEINVGWTVANNDELIKCFKMLYNDKDLIDHVSMKLEKIQKENTWEARCREVVKKLSRITN